MADKVIDLFDYAEEIGILSKRIKVLGSLTYRYLLSASIAGVPRNTSETGLFIDDQLTEISEDLMHIAKSLAKAGNSTAPEPIDSVPDRTREGA